MKRLLITAGLIFSLSATALPGVAFANDVSNCDYFAQFVTQLAKAHDDGKSRTEAEQMARDKAKADHLDKTTTNLFVGEASWLYYDKPKYQGNQTQVHTAAYNACINNDLP